MVCKHTATLAHGYIDRELDEARRMWFDAHVQGCPACAGVVARARALSAAIKRDVPRYPAPPHLAERIGRALDEAEVLPSSVGLAPPSPAPASPPPATQAPVATIVPLARRRRLAPMMRLAASFAAVAVLSSGLTWVAVTGRIGPDDDARVAAAVIEIFEAAESLAAGRYATTVCGFANTCSAATHSRAAWAQEALTRMRSLPVFDRERGCDAAAASR